MPPAKRKQRLSASRLAHVHDVRARTKGSKDLAKERREKRDSRAMTTSSLRFATSSFQTINCFPFFKLPAELREMVYVYLIPSEVKLGIQKWADHLVKEAELGESIDIKCITGPPITLNLQFLFTCRQIYEEASALIYRDTKLIIYTRANQPIIIKREQMRSNVISLRNRSIFPASSGLMFAHILSRFRHIDIHFSLPDMKNDDHGLGNDWDPYDIELCDISSLVSDASKLHPWTSNLTIRFWESSLLFKIFEQNSDIYRRFLKTMTTFHKSAIRNITVVDDSRASPASIQEAITKLKCEQLRRFNTVFSVKKNLLSVAITHSHHRHPLQRDVMRRERLTLTKLENVISSGDVVLNAGRDWRMCALLATSEEHLPMVRSAGEWDRLWIPDDSAICDDNLLMKIIDAPPEKILGNTTDWGNYWRTQFGFER